MDSKQEQRFSDMLFNQVERSQIYKEIADLMDMATDANTALLDPNAVRIEMAACVMHFDSRASMQEEHVNMLVFRVDIDSKAKESGQEWKQVYFCRWVVHEFFIDTIFMLKEMVKQIQTRASTEGDWESRKQMHHPMVEHIEVRIPRRRPDQENEDPDPEN